MQRKFLYQRGGTDLHRGGRLPPLRRRTGCGADSRLLHLETSIDISLSSKNVLILPKALPSIKLVLARSHFRDRLPIAEDQRNQGRLAPEGMLDLKMFCWVWVS